MTVVSISSGSGQDERGIECISQNTTACISRRSKGAPRGLTAQCMNIIWVVVLYPGAHGPQSSISFPQFKQTSLSPVCTEHFRRMCQLWPTKEEGERKAGLSCSQRERVGGWLGKGEEGGEGGGEGVRRQERAEQWQGY